MVTNLSKLKPDATLRSTKPKPKILSILHTNKVGNKRQQEGDYMQQPLAYRMRPHTIDEMVGQQHLIGPHQIIQRMIKAQHIASMILYGPPGVGKTSLAFAIAGSMKLPIYHMNAATDSKQQMTKIIEQADDHQPIILLLDEIHRLTKPKQDYLLPHLENGNVILIGATTENPYIAINPAIRSRTQIFELKPLQPEDIVTALKRALTDKTNGLGNLKIQIDDGTLMSLAESTHGDVRTALNALELAATSNEPDENGLITITVNDLNDCLAGQVINSDKNGDAHYDTISAFQKSIRGSDTDAALHYLARLIESGDLSIIMRRLMIIAYEDIGLADPVTAQQAITCINVANQVGLPEAKIPLANAVILLCLAPKSNSALKAIDRALDDLHQGNYGEIPSYLRDAHYKGATSLGRGIDYKYPHDYPYDWVQQQYLPDELKNRKYYHGSKNSPYEQHLTEKYEKLNEMQRHWKK